MKHLLRWTWILCVALATVFGPTGTASAQDATDGAEAPTEEGDLEAIWAERRTVRVIQRRLYPTDGEFQLTLFAGSVPNDPFINYFPVGLRFGYWFSESIAVELSGSFLLSTNTDLKEFLNAENVDVFERDEQLYRANAAVLWSPLYGKFSFLGNKLAHFDWYLGTGVGVVGVRNPVSGFEGVRTSDSIAPEVTVLTGWNLHLHDRWALRLDYRQGIFQKDGGGVAYPSEISLGGSFFF